MSNLYTEDIRSDVEFEHIDQYIDVDIGLQDASFDLDFGGMTVERRDYPFDVDGRSITYYPAPNTSILELVGYRNNAAQGQYPTYDAVNGLVLERPIITCRT